MWSYHDDTRGLAICITQQPIETQQKVLKFFFYYDARKENTVREEGKRATITIICTLIVHRALKEFGETDRVIKAKEQISRLILGWIGLYNEAKDRS